MEAEDQASRQSSLPSSLIPHLYSGPQLTRDAGETFRAPPGRSSPVASDEPIRPPTPPTTMAPVMTTSPAFVQGRSIYSPYGPIDPDMHSRNTGIAAPENLQLPGVRRAADTQTMPSSGQRYNNPIYSDPAYHVSRPFISYRGSGYAPPQGFPTWQELETGGPLPATGGPRTRIDQPVTEVFHNPAWSGEELETFQRSGIIQPRPRMAMPAARFYEAQVSKPGPSELPPPHALFPGPEAGSSAIYGGRHEAYGPPPSLTSASVAENLWPRRVESEPANAEESQEQERGPAQAGRNRRRESVEADNSTRKAGNARKTAVACNFCRGRKLRCNGARPLCHNCSTRQLSCEYVAVQRRRGPGKANKGCRGRGREGEVE